MKDINTNAKEQGFTLVELAIVMIIIGLLIAGILKGQQMIMNARITSTVSQIKAIDAAASTFSDMFSALPGDMANAANRLPSCTANCTTSGNQDGRVGTAVGNGIIMGSENRAFFSHLAAADLITGVSAAPLAIALNDSQPEAEVGGSGFDVGFTATGAATSLVGPNMRAGHYLVIRPGGTALTGALNNNGGLTQSQAARIDRKIDDGAPNVGSVRVGGNACASNATVTGIYQEGLETLSCNLFIRIQG